MRGLFGCSIFTAVLLSAAGLPAAAQPDGTEIFSELLACDPMTDPTQRLACYDAVLKQYKLRFGLLEGRADELAAQRRPATPTRQRPQQPQRPALPPAQVSQAPLGDLSDGAREAPSASPPAAASQTMTRAASPAELDLPYETTITGYNANSRGDFRLQVAEGFIFEDADGPGFSEDPTGKTVTLTRNFLGNWRMEVPGEGQLVWVKPLDRGDGSEDRPSRRTAVSQSGSPGGGAAAPAGPGRREESNTPPEPAQHPSDLDLPHETTITGYNANARGDFRLRIAEGFVFEDADGPGFTEDPTGKTVTLTKNIMGNWRLQVPGEGRLVWVKPLDQEPRRRRSRTAASSAAGGVASEGAENYAPAGPPQSPEDLDLPFETTITGYNANARGDFRLRIAEGFVFEDADGPGFTEDPTGKTVKLTKNIMGNWRMEVPGEGRLVWVKPVSGS